MNNSKVGTMKLCNPIKITIFIIFDGLIKKKKSDKEVTNNLTSIDVILTLSFTSVHTITILHDYYVIV